MGSAYQVKSVLATSIVSRGSFAKTVCVSQILNAKTTETVALVMPALTAFVSPSMNAAPIGIVRQGHRVWTVCAWLILNVVKPLIVRQVLSVTSAPVFEVNVKIIQTVRRAFSVSVPSARVLRAVQTWIAHFPRDVRINYVYQSNVVLGCYAQTVFVVMITAAYQRPNAQAPEIAVRARCVVKVAV